MDIVTSKDGTRIAFDRTGDGPALVMVDAAGSFRGFGPMTPVAEQLATSFTVYTYDRRGRGDSGDTAPYEVEREIEDLLAVIDAAGGSASVFGFSSGAVLVLHAAEAGLPIKKLALLEPPVDLTRQPSAEPDPLAVEINELVADGRRGDAYVRFNESVGVPAEMIERLREAPVWPALESLAHTLVYDLEVTGSMTADILSSVVTPTLVVSSKGSDERLQSWAGNVAKTLPNATHRSLPGEWHGVSPDVLCPALTEFLTS